MKRIILMAAITLLLVSCENKARILDSLETEAIEAAVEVSEARSSKTYEQKDEESSQKNSGSDDLQISGKSRVIEKVPTQIIKNSNIQFQVRDVDASHQKISDLLKQFNAYYGSDNKTTSNYRVDNNSVIRVPSSAFEKLMEELMKESVYTNYKNITAEDVTAEFVDIQARLKTKKEVELRYLALLKQANKITDILEVEDKLRVIREEIEATEGRLKLLKDQVGYSTITLNIYQKLDYTPEPEMGFFSNFKEAFVRGWRSMVDVFIALVRIWPFAIVWIVGMVFVYRRFMRKK